jgi:HK97 family phage prohead protease
MELERRFATEVQAKGRRLEGYCARFGVVADLGSFRERIVPGAFRASLDARDDIAALVDHNAEKLLGRTRSGTLTLHEDSTGLEFRVDLPTTSLASDILALAERGDLSGCSFGFAVRPDGESWQGDTRELRGIRLYEISILTGASPAYPNTCVTARAAHLAMPMRLHLAKKFLETV